MGGVDLAEVGEGGLQTVKSNPSEQTSFRVACSQASMTAKYILIF